MLGNTKWDTWEDSWNVAIMVSFCSELLKTKWNFEIEKLKFQYNLCLWALGYKFHGKSENQQNVHSFIKGVPKKRFSEKQHFDI